MLFFQEQGQPLYIQLYKQIKNQILSGEIPAQTRLPSVRVMSNNLAVSRNTVESAYRQLHAEGYVESRPRSGYYVAILEKNFSPRRLTIGTALAIEDAEKNNVNYQFDFSLARLAHENFPFNTWRKLWNVCIKEQQAGILNYSDPQGEWGLRKEIEEYLARSRGVSCTSEQIVICSGVHHSLSMIAQILQAQHSECAIEDPGYFVAQVVFRNYFYRVTPIPVTPDGIELERLTSSASRLVYITPSHQSPLGYVMPITNRLKLIDWAEQVGGVIIEDDYDSELRYYGKPIPSLQGINPRANIIYLGTFSKALSPSLRISYMVLPPPIMALYKEIFARYPASVSFLEQKTLQKFMQQGYWESHLRKLRTSYRKKHDVLTNAIERFMGDRVQILGQRAGLHIVVKVMGDYSESDLIQRARRKGIRVYPVSEHCIASSPQAMIVIGFGGMSSQEIFQGIERLSNAWF